MTLLSKVSRPTQFLPYSVSYMCTVVGQNKIIERGWGRSELVVINYFLNRKLQAKEITAAPNF